MKNFKIIIYNEDILVYFTGDVTNWKNKSELIENSSIYDHTKHFIPNPISHLEIDTYNSECKETIKLDETLMKRIAKYNKETEIQNLEKTIKEKQDKIKALDDILKDRDKRVEKLKEYVAKIYDIDLNDDKDYEDYDY